MNEVLPTAASPAKMTLKVLCGLCLVGLTLTLTVWKVGGGGGRIGAVNSGLELMEDLA